MTVATEPLLLTHVPPVVGDKVVVEPAHIVDKPVILTAGKEFTVTAAVGAETQPVVEFVNVNVAEPAATPVTTPAFVTVATDALELTHVPPTFGNKLVVLPTQIVDRPDIFTAGNAFTVTTVVPTGELQPETVAVTLYVPDIDGVDEGRVGSSNGDTKEAGPDQE